jgi:two-component system sensor histidine kinase DegS
MISPDHRKTNMPKNLRRRLSSRYLTALTDHLRGKRPGRVDRAQLLGRAALAAGLRTLDLAIMHEKAVVALAPSGDFANARSGSIRQAGVFFAEALLPLEEAQLATRARHQHLERRTARLIAGKNRLEQEILRRKLAEAVIRKGKEQYRTLFLQSQAMQIKLRQLTRQIILTQEEERKKISRELHDEVAQTLVGINVELATLGKGASTGLRALKEKIARTHRLVVGSVEMLHRFARDLRPPALDDLGLIPALHAYNKTLAARKKIRIQMTAFGGVEALGSAKRTVLYRVAQEALTNVARHAQATEVRMSITEIPEAIRMEISDNGRSFDVEKTLGAKTRTRLGLIGMKERIEMIGGTLKIDSKLGRGTTVCAEIPYNQKGTRK